MSTLPAARGDRLTIGIRHNLRPNVLRELFSKGKIQLGSEFDQFVMPVEGTVAAEVGAIVEVVVSQVLDDPITVDQAAEEVEERCKKAASK